MMAKKHTTTYHLKQLDKIAKTGEVPDEYKKIFKGIKNPQTHLKKVQGDINRIDRIFHEGHIKQGTDYEELCYTCNPDGKKRRKKNKVKETVEEKIEEEVIEEEVIEEIKDNWDNGW